MTRPQGFTLLETLVALLVAAVLLALLSRTMGGIILSSAILQEKSRHHEDSLDIRRLLHRDLMGMQGPDTLAFHNDGFSLITAHNHLVAAPVDVVVRWRFDSEGIVREESEPDIYHSFSQRLYKGLLAWTLEVRHAGLSRWAGLDSVILASESDKAWSEKVTGLRLTLEINSISADPVEWPYVEYVPHVPEPTL